MKALPIRLFALALWLIPIVVAAQHSVNQPNEVSEMEGTLNDSTADENVPEPLFQPIDLEYRYNFKFRQEYFVPKTYPSSCFENKKINIYRYDLTRLPDTFVIVMQDFLRNVHYTQPHAGRMTSRFGPRNMFGSSFHFGLDISLNTGDSVRSALDGVVRIVRKDPPGYGNFVVVTHMNGLETLYGHLDKPLVREGQHVKSGEAIGLGGNTGRSSGPHLHFEFRFMGEPIDPLRIISLKNGKPIHNSFVLDKTFFDHLRKLRGMAVLKTRNGGSLHGVGCDEVVPVSGELIERYYAACSCPNAHGAESEYLTELELEQIKYGILEPESLID